MYHNYNLLRDAYFSTGGFETGGYLERHKRETEEDYRTRQKMAHYPNYFATIVNALVDPVFKRKPLRDYEGAASVFAEAFLKDIDGKGAGIGEFMKQAGIMAKIYGVAFIVIDNAADEALTVQDALDRRAFPYAYVLPPDKVEDYGLNRMGGLEYIQFREVENIEAGTVNYRYTRFDREGWQVWGSVGGKTEGKYSLGLVPVVPLFARMLKDENLFPPPEFSPLAKAAKAIYNYSSWLDEILYNQTFPLLTIPTLDAKDITIGTNNALGYPPECSHAPAFIAPPSDPANILLSKIQSTVQEMYRMASLSFVGDNPNTSSGVARQWEFERTNQQLANFAAQCATAEKQMMQIFARWVGGELNYTVSYPLDFGIVDLAAELAEAQAVLDMQLTHGLSEEVLKKVLAAYCPDMSDERFDELVEELRQAETDRENAEQILQDNLAGAAKEEPEEVTGDEVTT